MKLKVPLLDDSVVRDRCAAYAITTESKDMIICFSL
jgi:hypothetical protein